MNLPNDLDDWVRLIVQLVAVGVFLVGPIVKAIYDATKKRKSEAPTTRRETFGRGESYEVAKPERTPPPAPAQATSIENDSLIGETQEKRPRHIHEVLAEMRQDRPADAGRLNPPPRAGGPQPQAPRHAFPPSRPAVPQRRRPLDPLDTGGPDLFPFPPRDDARARRAEAERRGAPVPARPPRAPADDSGRPRAASGRARAPEGGRRRLASDAGRELRPAERRSRAPASGAAA
ncbi:MAG TPA: hypothetical protein VK116_12175, partial [Planctomycetota bacterium]|nr:hypothetical protein [Planctomycetota bacterium]